MGKGETVKMTPEHKARMQAGREAAKGRAKTPLPPLKFKVLSPLAAIRKKCMDCGTTSKYVAFCTCTPGGDNGTPCPLWPYRFGKRPKSVLRTKFAPLMDPDNIPDSLVELEKCRWPGEADA